MNQNILVTGANGQLGSELRSQTSGSGQFSWRFTDIDELDITNEKDLDAFFSSAQFHWIINCAAYTAVDKAESESSKAFQINQSAVENLVRQADKQHAGFIHISTDYVFDGRKSKPYLESDAPRPLSVYGKSKRAGEQAALSYPRSIVLRTSWLYSRFGGNFVKTMMRLTKERDSLKVIYDQTGSPTNAYDLAGCMLQIIGSTDSGQADPEYGLFHYSGEGVCSWYDFAMEIAAITQSGCSIQPIGTEDYPTPATRPHYTVLSKEKIKNTWQLSIPYWKESLKKCIFEIQSNS